MRRYLEFAHSEFYKKFFYAVMNDIVSDVSMILDMGFKPYNFIHEAVEYKSYNVLKLLLEREMYKSKGSFKYDISTGIYMAIESDDLRSLQILMEYLKISVNEVIEIEHQNGGETLLFLAARYGASEICKHLVKLGADPFVEFSGMTACLVALRFGHGSIGDFLSNVERSYYTEGNLNMKLRIAVELRDIEWMNELISDGADVNQVDSWHRPILVNEILNLNDNHPDLNVIKCLLKNGANPNPTFNFYGENVTPLMCLPCWVMVGDGAFANYKQSESYQNIADLLIKYGADIKFKNENNTTLADYALKYKSLKWLDFYISRGAEVTDNVKEYLKACEASGKMDRLWLYVPSLRRRIHQGQNPWRQDPHDAYNHYLSYARDETRRQFQNFMQIQALESKDLKLASDEVDGVGDQCKSVSTDLHVHNGEWLPFDMNLTPLKAEKLSIRNVDNLNMFLDFKKFGESPLDYAVGVPPGCIEILAEHKANDKIQIAHRWIVPSEFSEEPQLAGSLRYDEVILDGADIKKHNAFISITLSTEQAYDKYPPFQITLENSSGDCYVSGLSDEQIAHVISQPEDRGYVSVLNQDTRRVESALKSHSESENLISEGDKKTHSFGMFLPKSVVKEDADKHVVIKSTLR